MLASTGVVVLHPKTTLEPNPSLNILLLSDLHKSNWSENGSSGASALFNMDLKDCIIFKPTHFSNAFV